MSLTQKHLIKCTAMNVNIFIVPLCNIIIKTVELAWRSDSVMDCHATARGSIPFGNGVKTSRPSQGTINGGCRL